MTDSIIKAAAHANAALDRALLARSPLWAQHLYRLGWVKPPFLEAIQETENDR